MVSEQLRRPRKMVSSDSRSKPGKAKQRAQTVRRPGLTGAARLRRWCRDLYRFPFPVARLALAARIRNLRQIHSGRR
jgi:hypothetical protein